MPETKIETRVRLTLDITVTPGEWLSPYRRTSLLVVTEQNKERIPISVTAASAASKEGLPRTRTSHDYPEENILVRGGGLGVALSPTGGHDLK